MRTAKISLAEPVTALRHVKIKDNGEPLVDFLEAAPRLVLSAPRFDYRRATVARATVAQMLRVASESVLSGYRLAVIEAWRPPHIQRRMYLAVWNLFRELHPAWSDVQLRRVVNRFTAPLSKAVPPPHSTGGAVDVVLQTLDGQECDLTSPFKRTDPAGFLPEAPGLSDQARRNRAILAEAMIAGGFTNYPSEYWHWSYGDQGWAYRGGHSHALYGATEPPGFAPDPDEAIDSPIALLID